MFLPKSDTIRKLRFLANAYVNSPATRSLSAAIKEQHKFMFWADHLQRLRHCAAVN